jgi:hypothetical protein
MRQVDDAIELVARLDALAVDHLLDRHGAGGGRRPIDGARVGAFVAHLVDAAFRHREIAQALHGALDAGRADQLRHLRPDRDQEIDLRLLDLRAVDAKQRLAGLHGAAGGVDEQLLDEAVGAHRHDGLPAFVDRHGADRVHRLDQHVRLDLLGAHAAALHAIEADLDAVAVLGLVAVVDRDVVHAH